MDAATQEKIRKTNIGISSILAVDLFDLSMIFYFATTFKPLFESILRYAFLPIAFTSAWMIGVLTLRQAYLKKFPGQLTAKAVIELVCAAALTASVIGGFIAAATFAVAGPALIACAFGCKSLYNFGSAIYFGVKAARTSDPIQKYELKKLAIESFIGGLIGALSTAGIITVLLLAKPALAILGIIAGAIGCTAAVIKCIDLIVRKPESTAASSQEHPKELSNNAKIAKAVSLTDSGNTLTNSSTPQNASSTPDNTDSVTPDAPHPVVDSSVAAGRMAFK